MGNLRKKQTNKYTKSRNRCRNTENNLMVARSVGLGVGKMDEGEWEVQASSYVMNKSQG